MRPNAEKRYPWRVVCDGVIVEEGATDPTDYTRAPRL